MSRTYARWVVAHEEGSDSDNSAGVWLRLVSIMPDDPDEMPRIMLTEQLAVLDIRERGQRFTRAN